MREKLFQWIAKVTYRRYLLVFFLCLALTIVSIVLASNIKMDASWRALVPQEHPSVKTFDKVLDEFGAVTQIIIAVEGPNKERIIQAAEELAPQLYDVTMELPVEGKNGEFKTKKVVKRVDIQYDTTFFSKHGFMLEKAKNLKKNRILYTDYNIVPFLTHINDVLETQYVQDSDNLTKQEKEAVRGLDGMYQFLESMWDFAEERASTQETVSNAVRELTIGDGYYLSNDKKMLLIIVTPTMTINDIDITVAGVNKLDEKLKQFNNEYSDVHFSMTGMHVVMRDEMESGMSDTRNNLIFALVIILLVFIFSFRMFSGPFLAMLVLISGITWDIALAYLFIGRLNIFTATCSVILIGLGVDYAIHIISAYTEFRHKGHSIEEAISEAFSRIGTGLVTGAVTTAAAFLALTFTSFHAFREFGFVVGTGIICCLLASLFFLPAALVIKEKIWGKIRRSAAPKQVDMEFKFLGKISEIVSAKPWVTIAVVMLLTVFFIFFIPQVQMNKNYMDMEPEGLESVQLQREIPKRFNMSPDNMMAIVDNLEEASRITDQLNERQTIGLVESVSDFLPTKQKQIERIPIVKLIAEDQKELPNFTPVNVDILIEQLNRFNDNLIEMSDLAFIGGLDKVFDKINSFLGMNEEGDQIGINRVDAFISVLKNTTEAAERLNLYQRLFMPAMEIRIRTMANPETITFDMVPENITERFVSSDGSHFLVAIYSKKDIWDGLFTTPFLETIIHDVPNATGTPVLMKVMVNTAKEQGTFAFFLAFIAFVIILLIDFRNLKITLIAMLPLLIALTWMLGIMGLTGFSFSIVNVIGLPLILGIGIDDGVHIIHRCRKEGKDKLSYSISSIGKAIFLTTLTTVLEFGSLIPSIYRGYASLGILLCMGIGLCFITSVIILPAFMKIIWGRQEGI